MAARGPLVFSVRIWHKHVKDMAPIPDLVTPLPWMEIECANLPLIPHPPHVLLLSLSVRSYEYNTFSQSASFSCVFFCCLDPSLAWWLHLGPFGFPLTSFLGSCQSCFPLPNLRVTCCAQEVIPSFLPSLTPTSGVL